MSDILTYTLSLQDQVSAKLQKIGISSMGALDIFSKLQSKSIEVNRVMKEMGGSLGALRQRVNLLQAEKEWIPISNLTSIRKYNTEIRKLEKQIHRLDTINGSVFKTKLRSAISHVPYGELITNPVALSAAALFGAGKMALSFDESMAKINTTAQLTPDKLSKLKRELISVGTSVGANLSTIPESFEKILSQTNDLALSQDILKQSLIGSKAGFTDQTVVADALAQTLSLVGKENTNAQQVLDTFFAAKRVGAGEFKDFANYVPGLIASGKALGVGFQETAGLFAFMTGKGQSAERSAVLMQNAFTALGKSEITKGLADEGVSVFNLDGSMKQMDEIFGQLQIKLQGFGKDDKAKSDFLEKIGLRDAQAKQAFMILSSDSKKLSETLSDVTNAAGEADQAFKNSANPMQKIQMLWSKIQQLAISFGGIISSVLVPALTAVLFVTTPLIDALSWLFDGISQGNLLAYALAGAIGVLTAAWYYNAIAAKVAQMWTKRKLVVDKLSSVWANITAGATWLWTAAQWALNVALNANPLGLIVIAIAALVGIVILAWKKLDWFRGIVYATWEAIKGFGIMIKDYIIDRIKGLIIGLSGIAGALFKLFRGDWKGAWSEAKEAVGDLVGIEARQNAINNAMETGRKVGEAYKKGVADFHKGKDKADGIINPDYSHGLYPSYITGASGMDGIKPPIVPGAVDSNRTDETNKTTEAIATGGTKNTTVNINFGRNLVESINISKEGGFKENAKDMADKVLDQLTRVLTMAQANAV